MKSRIKLLVFGAGRMGLSHAAMARLLYPEIEVDVFEPEFRTRVILNAATGREVRFVKEISDYSVYTHAIIASPPAFHNENFKTLRRERFAGKILVEKPVRIDSLTCNPIFRSGYVLRHNRYIQRILKETAGQSIVRLEIELKTNQDFSIESGSWRMGKGDGALSLLTEFGSHCINLALLLQGDDLEVASCRHEENMVQLDCRTCNDSFSSIRLGANCGLVRKSVYNVSLVTSRNKFTTDLYSFQKYSLLDELLEATNLAKDGASASGYLRGIDFADQMEDFLIGQYDETDAQGSLMTDVLMDEIGERFFGK